MGNEKGVLIGEKGDWKALMENIYGRKGFFSAHYLRTKAMSKEDLNSEEKIELKRRNNLELYLDELINGLEPDYYSAKIDLPKASLRFIKNGPIVSVRVESKDLEGALKTVGDIFLNTGYNLTFTDYRYLLLYMLGSHFQAKYYLLILLQ